MFEDALDMEIPRHRLRHLDEYLPNSLGAVSDLGMLFADYLKNDELVPRGFLLATHLALHDISTSGVNGWTGEKIRNPLVGMPPQVFAALQLRVDSIARAVLPQEFAEAVVELGRQARETYTNALKGERP